MRKKPAGFVTLKKRYTHGPRKGKRKRAPIMPSSGRASQDFKISVREIQASRSQKAKSMDAHLKAKIAKDEQEWAKQPNRRDLKGVDYPQRQQAKSKTTHTHWMVTPDGKHRERIEHEKSLKHTNVYSQRRHSLETGAMQAWLKKRNLKMYDANKERYEREVIIPQVKRNKGLKKVAQKSKWKYGVLWRNTEGKVGYSITEASSKTEAHENAKKFPLFKEVISAKHESESEHLRELQIKEALSRSPKTPISQQWNNLSKESRKKVLNRADLNEKWADYEFNDLPNFVQDDMYSITAGTHRGWKKKSKQKPKPISNVGGVASYNKATGWMRVVFDSKPSREVLDSLKANGFRYKPRSKAWSAKWTPEREDHAKKLVGNWQTVDIKPNWAKKAERSAELEGKHLEESERRYMSAKTIMDVIPLGQPILVGHHSEKRHRRDLKRIDQNLRKSREEREKAEHFARKAQRYGRKAIGESPITIHNRIQKLEAEERKHKRNIQQIKEDPENYFLWLHKLDAQTKKKRMESATARQKRWLKHTQERLRIEREKYKASGGIPMDNLTVKTGDRVNTRWGKGTVGRISPNTVRIKLDPMSNGREVTIYPDSKGYSKLDRTDIIGKL